MQFTMRCARKGYNPVNQIVGYIMSGDPTYITSHNNARSLIMKVERDELVEELLKEYIANNVQGNSDGTRLWVWISAPRQWAWLSAIGLGLTAQGVEIIRRTSENKLRQTLARIESLIGEYEVGKIVLGFPEEYEQYHRRAGREDAGI